MQVSVVAADQLGTEMAMPPRQTLSEPATQKGTNQQRHYLMIAD
jgi:hypothetical protein